MDLVGKKILSKMISIVLIFFGILFMNRLISFSITGNGIYDSMLLITLGLIVFIIGHAFKGQPTRNIY